MAKRKSLPPRRLRMKRSGRLQSARGWLAKFRGRHIARAYSRWYGVDRLCAIQELRMLGVQLDPNYVRAVEITYREKSRCKPQSKPQPEHPHGVYGIDFDENFEFIAGHTEGGAAFGVSWEQRNEQARA
jgi:hypothetical protein